jgi:hypothetical protein
VAVAGRGTLSKCPLKGIDLPLVAGEVGLRAQGTHRLILGSEAQTSMMGMKDVKLGEPEGEQWLLLYTNQDRGYFLK